MTRIMRDQAQLDARESGNEGHCDEHERRGVGPGKEERNRERRRQQECAPGIACRIAFEQSGIPGHAPEFREHPIRGVGREVACCHGDERVTVRDASISLLMEVVKR
jgi:hypothetical protein